MVVFGSGILGMRGICEMKRVLTFSVAFAATCLLTAAEPCAPGRYWMSSPAKTWTEALPLGNGRLGALVFGQPNVETIVLNESSVWAPPTVQPFNPEGAAVLPEIRRLLFEGKAADAERLCSQRLLRGGSNVASYQPLAFLQLAYAPDATPYTDYTRGLNLREGLGWIRYAQGGVSFAREAFVAYDDDVAVFTTSADRPGAVSFTLTLNRPGGASVTVVPPNRLRLSGTTGKGGVAFDALAEVVTEGGTVTPEGNGLAVRGASRATVRVAAFTDYNFRNPKQPLARNRLAACEDALARVAAKSAQRLRSDHVAAFEALYGRTFVRLPEEGKASQCPSVEALLATARKERRFDAHLLTLYYDFCRYLLISSSRPGGLPANLQGIWNPLMNPPWNSDWHLDINLSMFYWPATAWDLGVLAEPLLSLAEMGFEASRPVAREMLGVPEGGFMTTCSDIWGYVTPFRHPCWGMYVGGGAWLLQDALLPWRASQDTAWMRRALPLLRSQAQFYLNWLVRHPKTGRWVSGPSCSPENTYRSAGGNAAVDMGPTHDQELIYATLSDYLSAARAFTPDDPLIARAEATLKELAMPGIGPDGALMEWSQPFAEAEPAHRHLSHLWGMMPGRRISLRETPREAEAVRKSIAKRVAAGHHLMGWSIGHRACLDARLGDAEAALSACDAAPQYLCGNLFTSAVGKPQVADMNGVPAAVNEMLLRSYAGTLEILPALPKRFAKEGAFRLLADGGFLVEAAWKEGRVVSLKVTSRLGGPCRLRFNGAERTLETQKGETIRVLGE